MASDIATTNAYGSLLDDLRAEGKELDAIVAPLDAIQWAAPTPAEGWTIAHQIAHLAWTDARAHLALTEPAAFEEEARAEFSSGWTGIDKGAADGARLPPETLLDRWHSGREALYQALAAAPADAR